MVHHLDSRCVLICAACLFLHASQWKVSELQAPLLKYWLHSSLCLPRSLCTQGCCEIRPPLFRLNALTPLASRSFPPIRRWSMFSRQDRESYQTTRHGAARSVLTRDAQTFWLRSWSLHCLTVEVCACTATMKRSGCGICACCQVASVEGKHTAPARRRIWPRQR